jgi:hypothetical protein
VGVATQNTAIFINLSGSGKCPVAGCWEYGNEISAFVEGDKFLFNRTNLDFVQGHCFMEIIVNT